MINDSGQESLNIRFENFADTLENEDLFDKADRFDRAVKSGIAAFNEGLDIITMNRVQPDLKIREKDGSIHEVIMLGSNSYLNLSTHPQVTEGAFRALEQYGYGMGAAANNAGITDIHRELEQRIAKFHGAEDCILFSSGFSANIGIIPALCGKGDVIINDAANNASIYDGCMLSGAEIKVFPHRDMKGLEKILSKLPKEQTGRLIVTDGVFAASGGIAPLKDITDLAEKYKCRVMVDDSHGLGVTGSTGRGSAEYSGAADKIDLNVSSLSKSTGGSGGYCAASRKIVRYLRLYARSCFFSASLPAPIAGGLNEAFKLLETDSAGRKELMEKTEYLKKELTQAGLDTGHSQSAIIPVMVYSEPLLFEMRETLRKKGVYVNAAAYPAVRRKECCLRLCMMKDLTYSRIDRAAEIIIETAREYGLIK